MFIGPMSFEMVKPQLTAVYTTSVKPLVDVAVMKLHKVAMDLHSLDRNRLGLIGAGVVVVLFVIWRMLSSYISLFGVASLLLTGTCTSVVWLVGDSGIFLIVIVTRVQLGRCQLLPASMLHAAGALPRRRSLSKRRLELGVSCPMLRPRVCLI